MLLAYFSMIRKVNYGRTFSVRFSPETIERLQQIAQNRTTPTHKGNKFNITTLIRDIVEAYLKNIS